MSAPLTGRPVSPSRSVISALPPCSMRKVACAFACASICCVMPKRARLIPSPMTSMFSARDCVVTSILKSPCAFVCAVASGVASSSVSSGSLSHRRIVVPSAAVPRGGVMCPFRIAASTPATARRRTASVSAKRKNIIQDIRRAWLWQVARAGALWRWPRQSPQSSRCQRLPRGRISFSSLRERCGGCSAR